MVIVTDEDFRLAAAVWIDVNPGAFQGARFIDAATRKIYDEQPAPVDVTPDTAILEAALSSALAALATQQQHDSTVAGMKTAALIDFDASALKNKTPAQIQTFMQNKIDAWTSLADARADLRVWLPLMARIVAYLMEKEHP